MLFILRIASAISVFSRISCAMLVVISFSSSVIRTTASSTEERLIDGALGKRKVREDFPSSRLDSSEWTEHNCYFSNIFSVLYRFLTKSIDRRVFLYYPRILLVE